MRRLSLKFAYVAGVALLLAGGAAYVAVRSLRRAPAAPAADAVSVPAGIITPRFWLDRADAGVAGLYGPDEQLIALADLAEQRARAGDRPAFESTLARLRALEGRVRERRRLAQTKVWVAAAHARLGDDRRASEAVDEAFRISAAAGQPGLPVVTVVYKFVAIGQLDRALAVARAHGGGSSQFLKIALAYAEAGRSAEYAGAIRLAEERARAEAAEPEGELSTPLRWVAETQVSARDFGGAERTAGELPPADAAEIHALIASGRLDAGDRNGCERSVGAALGLLRRAADDTSKSSYSRRQAYQNLGRLFARDDATGVARVRATVAADPSAAGAVDAGFYAARAGRFADAGQAAPAIEALRAYHAAVAGKDAGYTEVFFNISRGANIAARLAAAGAFDAARQVCDATAAFARAEHAGVSQKVAAAENASARQLAAAAGLPSTTRPMDDVDYASHVESILAVGYAERGRFADAVASYARLKPPGPWTGTASKIVEYGTRSAGTSAPRLADVLQFVETLSPTGYDQFAAYLKVADVLLEQAEAAARPAKSPAATRPVR